MKFIKRMLSVFIALTLLVSAVPMSAITASALDEATEYPSILLDEEKIISTEQDSGVAIFSFEPTETGFYVFYSYNNSFDTYGHLYDAQMEELDHDDDGGEAFNFRLDQKLIAGEKYYVKSRPLDEGATGTYMVKIIKIPAPQSLTIGNGETLSAYVGDSMQIDVVFGPEGCGTEDITWHVDNEEMVVEFENYTAYFYTAGTTTITATTESGLTDSIEVTVIERPQATSIIIDQGDFITGYVKRSVYLTASFMPENCVYETITWSSDNEEVATVDGSGEVKLLTEGSATITATSERGFTDSIEVSAEEIPTITCDETKIVTDDVNRAVGIYSFVPSEDGAYAFYSFDANKATYGEILDENMETLADDWYDSPESGYEFKVVYEMTAGTQYYLYTTTPWDIEDTEFSVIISKLTAATSVEIIPDKDLKIFEGRRYSLSAKLHPENAIDETLTWLSDDETVATVDNEGNVTAVAEGDATITVITENNLTDIINLTVYAPKEIGLAETKAGAISPEFLEDVFAFSPQEDGRYRISFECSEYICTEVVDSEGEYINGTSGSWYSFDVDLISGETYNIITFLSEGIGSADYSITIEKLVPATSLNIVNYDEIETYFVGNAFYLYTEFGPENALEENVTWQTSNPAVAPISYIENGEILEDSFVMINFISSGTATITATSENGLTDTFDITVVERPAATELTIVNGDNLSGFVGITRELWIESFPDYSLVKGLTWSSSDETVATVDEEGIVTFLKEGTVIITVTSDEGLSDTCTFTVKEPEILTTENPVFVTIINNEVQYLKFTPSESGILRFYFTEISNDNKPELNVFDSSMGWLTGWDDVGFSEYVYEAGETYYISTDFWSLSNDGDGTYYINMAKPVPATSISFDLGSEYEGYIGDERTLNVVYEPIYAFTENIEWKSSDSNIVSVNEYGEITLNAQGTATITATTENGLEATLAVTVKAYETIELDGEKNITLGAGDEAYYSFTPAESGYYAFYSYNNDHDTYGYILNSDMEELNHDDDDGEANNFKVKHYLEAGVTYILKARFFSEEQVGSFNVSVKKVQSVTALELVSMPNKAEIFEGAGTNYINYNGLKLKVTWSDTSQTEWEYNDEFGWYIEDSQVEQNFENFDENGEVVLICDDVSVTLTFTFIENPVDHIELVSKGTRTIYFENYEGEIKDDEDGRWYYYYTRYPWDAQVKIVYKDGTSTISNIEDDVQGYRIEWDDNQYDTPWVVGTENKSTISYLGHTVNLPITVKKKNIDHIEVVSVGSYATYFENYGGEIKENEDGEYFYYYTQEPWDAKIKIVYKDGTSVTTKLEDAVDGYNIEWRHNQDETPWVLGTENKSTISYLGYTANLPITVKKNNVKNIEVVSGKVTCIENAYGEQWEGGFYYYYTIPSNVTIKINYTDGTSKTANIFDTVDGQSFDYISYQEEKPWVLGDNNSITVRYLDATAELPVSVIKSPVDRIELITAPTRKYVYGDNNFGYLYSDGSYEFTPYDKTGLSFKVYYKNGSTKTFTHYDIDPVFGTLDGYFVDLFFDGENAQVGNIPVTLHYMGKTLSYTVELMDATHRHTADLGTIVKKATCKDTGLKLYKCTSCQSSLSTELLPKTAHNYSAATCTKPQTCKVCNATKGTKLAHKYLTGIVKATLSKNGSIVKKCSCGHVASVTAIKYVKSIKLSATSYTYNGKSKKPTVTVKDSSGKTLKKDVDYTVSYSSGRKSVGTYKVTIKMKGNYSGTKILSFKINPPKTSVKKLTAGKKSLKVSIKKKTTQVTGYEIQYSTSKKFKSAKKVTIKKAKTTSATIKKLKAKKTYYVRVRTYKTVKGKKYYSGWSSYKSKKTK